MVSPSLRRQQDTISNRMNDPKWLLDQENPRFDMISLGKKMAASSDKINKGPQVTIKTIAITAFNPKIAKFDLDDCYMGALTSGDNTQLTWHVNRCGKTNVDLTKVKRAQATNMEISEQTAKLKYDTMRSKPANTCKLKMRHASSSRCASGHNLASPLTHPLHEVYYVGRRPRLWKRVQLNGTIFSKGPTDREQTEASVGIFAAALDARCRFWAATWTDISVCHKVNSA